MKIAKTPWRLDTRPAVVAVVTSSACISSRVSTAWKVPSTMPATTAWRSTRLCRMTRIASPMGTATNMSRVAKTAGSKRSRASLETAK